MNAQKDKLSFIIVVTTHGQVGAAKQHSDDLDKAILSISLKATIVNSNTSNSTSGAMLILVTIIWYIIP